MISEITCEDYAVLVLEQIRELAIAHAQHWPGDPVAALCNIAVVAEAHLASIAAMDCPPAAPPRLEPLPEILARLGTRLRQAHVQAAAARPR